MPNFDDDDWLKGKTCTIQLTPLQEQKVNFTRSCLGSHSDSTDVPRTESGFSTSQGPRSKQEDNLVIVENEGLWGVFDGHKGETASQFASFHLVDVWNFHCTSDADVGQALVETLIHLDEEMRVRSIGSGTTACVAHLKGNRLFIANLGDSRALVGSASGVRFCTVDHKADSVGEQARLSQLGGSLECGRILGEINVSRGLGDFDIKASTNVFSNIADVYEIALSRGDFLVMATDGLWDVMSDVEVMSEIVPLLGSLNEGSESETPRNVANLAAQSLVTKAVTDKRSGDNVTAVVVLFK